MCLFSFQVLVYFVPHGRVLAQPTMASNKSFHSALDFITMDVMSFLACFKNFDSKTFERGKSGQVGQRLPPPSNEPPVLYF